MAKWKGQSRGTVLGLRIYVFIIRNLGLYPAYFVLWFVVLYFIFFSFTSTRSTFYLFRRRLGHSFFRSCTDVFLSYFTFGRIQIDRLAIGAGMEERFSFHFDGVENIKELLKENQGGILLTAHIGNFNLAKHFFTDKKYPVNINLVMSDLEHRQIKNYVNSVTGKSHVKTIVLKDDLSHIFRMHKALDNNELLVFAADRYLENSKTYTQEFMGKPVQFPQGPFKLAIRNNIPVLFVHIMRERKFHYHFYARRYENSEKSARNLLKSYLENLESLVRKYPYQWYNYYDYWNDFNE